MLGPGHAGSGKSCKACPYDNGKLLGDLYTGETSDLHFEKSTLTAPGRTDWRRPE